MDTNVYTQDVTKFSELPIPDQERKRTDVFCTICTGLFALILFIVSCAVFNNQNLVKMTYYVDGQGNVCGYDQQVRNYPLMYFTSLNNATKRLCVAECPKAGDTELSCYQTSQLACTQNKNPQFQVTIYDSATEVNRIGGICRPTDPTLADQVDQMSRMESKYTFLTIYDSIWTSLWISLLFGVLLIILLQCMTRKIVHWMFILGSLTFIALGLVLIIVPDGFILFKIIGGLAFIFLGALVAATYLNPEFRKEVFISSRLYQVSATIVKQRPLILLAILIWSALQVGLLALTGFQLLSAWSIGPLVFDPTSPFLKTNSFISNFLSFFVFFEFIWGLSFLKQSFNFCISGYATNWYCHRDHNQSRLSLFQPARRLFKFHWGSVAGGSLLLFMFYFFDLVIDFFWSTDTAFAEQGREIKSEPFTRKTLDRRGCRGFFDLIRSQSFGYINLIPIPYCNASRYCEMLADDSTFYDRSQTTNRLYRLSAHIVIMMISTLIAFASNKHTDQHPGIFGVFFVAMVSLFSVTYFISLHADLAEGILISIFLEQRLSQFGKQTVNGKLDHGSIQQPPEIVKTLYKDDMHDIYSNGTIPEYLRGHLMDRAVQHEKEHAPSDLF